jgi:hypothetical protein
MKMVRRAATAGCYTTAPVMVVALETWPLMDRPQWHSMSHFTAVTLLSVVPNRHTYRLRQVQIGEHSGHSPQLWHALQVINH